MSEKRADSIIRTFDARRVRALPGQPRKRFRGIKELAESIAEVGQIANGVVTLVHGDPKFDAQLVDGERRLRACQIAGKPFRAEVRPDAEAEAIFVASFAANFGKQDHDAIEIAEGLDRMRQAGKSMTQLGRIAGRSSAWVAQHLNLLKLDPAVRDMMIRRDDEESAPISFAIAQLLVPLAPAQQIAVAGDIVRGEAMSLTAARRYVLKVRSNGGDKSVYVNKTGRARQIDSLASIVLNTSDRVGVYMDMPGPDFNGLVDAMEGDAKAKIVEQIESLVENLSALADTIQRRNKAAIKSALGAGK